MFRYRGDPRWLRRHPFGGWGDGQTYGAASLPGPCSRDLMVIFSSPGGDPDCAPWEHVSVSTPKRTPTWGEMCFVKDLFWDAEDCVVQYHPPRSSYVNQHPFCLHLWRPVGVAMLLPPADLVGALEGRDG